jgi:hypothetical protein
VTRRLAVIAAALLLSATRAQAQAPDTLPGLRLRLRTDTLRLLPPPAWIGAGGALSRPGPAEVAERWADAVRARIAARNLARRRSATLGDTLAFAVTPADQFADLPGVAFAADVVPQRSVQFLARYADLGIQMNALLEMKFDRLRNLRCTPSDAGQVGNGCSGGFNPPRVDPQFSIRTGGVVGQRVHVNVDYDTQREFDASNNIQVAYQGLEDEILRRVEVGNVTFAAPRSRFITGGIPANNFGVAVQAEVGALQFGVLFAQQKGNIAKARLFSIGNQAVQPVDRFLADRDLEPQRFFFVRNPRSFPGYPAIDVLNFNNVALADSIRVTQVRIYRNRSTIGRSVTQTNLTGIQAIASRRDSPQRAGPVAWDVLTEGRDYYLDPSGLWFALTARLDQEDRLAVSYITASGDTVGTFPAVAQAGRVDTLELISDPRSGPEVPTFYYELRNVYRVGAVDDINRASVGIQLLVNGSARPQTGAATFLDLLGLALQTDATSFDQYNRLFPRQRDPASGAPLRELFVILPHLTPFADSARLAPEYRTDSLYRTPSGLLHTQGPAPLWQLSLHYDARGGDNRGTILLGGYQIRTGSERVIAGGHQLTRNVEYTINYEIGQVTFLNPDSLFPQATQVTVQFEENQAFVVAPTSIYGLSARYDLGDHGSISALGILQRQHSTFTRPPLGFEPSSNAVMGVAGNFRFEPMRITRLLDGLPLIRTSAPSSVTLDAEIATSRPSPNELGVAYVETFEGESGLFLPLTESSWEYGSRPSSPRGTGATGIDPVLGFSDNDAVPLTWQNLILTEDGKIFQATPQSIDPSIVLQGTSTAIETVLWMSLYPDTIGGLPDPRTFRNRWLLPHTPGPRWRSMTQPLSATGIDLSRIEYLEFWVLDNAAQAARNAGLSLVFDFGTVFEDAVDFLPTAFTSAGADTTYGGRRRAGPGRLDSERDTLTGSFNAVTDDNGILGDVADSILNGDNNTIVRNLPLCASGLAQGQLLISDWGSLFPHCTRKNGAVDTEDLNNDQHLDTLIAAQGEQHFRFTVRVGDPRYIVRDGGAVAASGTWRLYRIPFRADTVQVGTPDIRQVRALRLTVVAPSSAQPESTLFFAMTRMRLVGAPWVKRTGAPIAGLSGQTPQPHGEVVASVISTEDSVNLRYSSPPGVTDQGQTVTGSVQVGATQINEKSLRLIASDVRVGERAEAYYRFPEGERNFLGYRELRVWARGRGNGWDQKQLTFFVKVGQDENNFYLYRQPLSTATWDPEAVVDFQQWFALRALIEQRFLGGQAPSGAGQCGGDSLAYVACSGPYLVHVRNPAVAPPNLTRVQELAVGFVRDSGNAFDSAEVWVDDIRLTQVVNDRGYAAAVNLNITAADVADVNVLLSRRDGNFRQLGETPSYSGSSQLSVNSTIRLERLGLERLGLTAPLTLHLDQSSTDPYFVSNTDVLASSVSGLRTTRLNASSWGVQVRRSRRGTQWWQRAITDNLGFQASFSRSNARTELSTAVSRISDVRADYNASPRELSVRYLPGFLREALDGLPGFLRRSEMVRGLREGRLRLTPSSLSFSSGVTHASSDRASYRVPIATPFDVPLPVLATTANLRSAGSFELRPFQSLALGATATWDRDLKDYGDSTTVGAIASGSTRQLLGMGIGFVRQRTLSSRLSWVPPVASWLRPRFTWNSDFALSRDPNARDAERSDGDTTGTYRLPTTFGSGMSAELSASVDLSRLLRGVFGDSSGARRLLDRVTQLDLGRRIERRSQFDRPGFDPSAGYMLGLGGVGGFLARAGRLANAAQDQVQDRASLVLRLPLSVAVTGSYGERAAAVWYLRGTAQQVQRNTETDWPNVSARWLWSPRTGWIRRWVASFNTSVGYQLRSAVSEQPSLDQATSAAGGLSVFQDTRARPFSVAIVWAPGITTSLTHGDERTVAQRSGNTTRSERVSNSADASFHFKPPQEFIPLKSDVRTSVRYQRSLNAICVERAGAPGCTRIADSHRSEYNLTMDTDMPPSVNAGFSVGYVLSDDRHINRKFSQFTLTASVRVFFSAGEIR